jgi:hypothetical protein
MKSLLDIERSSTKEIDNFYAEINGYFEQFKKKHEYGIIIQLDKITLQDLLMKWNKTKAAFVARHNHIDSKHRETALLMYHIIKDKPIFFKSGQADPRSCDDKYFKGEYIAINEFFSFFVATIKLGPDLAEIDDKLQDRFVYSLYNFISDPDLLSVGLELLLNIMRGRQLINIQQLLIEEFKKQLDIK